MRQKFHSDIENAGMQSLNKEKHILGNNWRDGVRIERQERRNESMNSLREESELKGRKGGMQGKLPELAKLAQWWRFRLHPQLQRAHSSQGPQG